MIVTPFGVVGESIVSIAIRNECSCCFGILVSWIIPGMILPFRNVVGFFDVYYKSRWWKTEKGVVVDEVARRLLGGSRHVRCPMIDLWLDNTSAATFGWLEIGLSVD
jgi:hypothetical protein